jgi:hypothetical protein
VESSWELEEGGREPESPEFLIIVGKSPLKTVLLL